MNISSPMSEKPQPPCSRVHVVTLHVLRLMKWACAITAVCMLKALQIHDWIQNLKPLLSHVNRHLDLTLTVPPAFHVTPNEGPSPRPRTSEHQSSVVKLFVFAANGCSISLQNLI